MRYFTKELWRNMNSSDVNTRKEAEYMWLQNSCKYNEYFESVKAHLPRSFLKQFQFLHGFHDYTIVGINTTSRSGKYVCELHLSKEGDNLYLTLADIKAVKISVESFLHCVQGQLGWGYSEFEWMPSKNIRLSILCDIENELQFEFKRLTLARETSI